LDKGTEIAGAPHRRLKARTHRQAVSEQRALVGNGVMCSKAKQLFASDRREVYKRREFHGCWLHMASALALWLGKGAASQLKTPGAWHNLKKWERLHRCLQTPPCWGRGPLCSHQPKRLSDCRSQGKELHFQCENHTCLHPCRAETATKSDSGNDT